MSEKVAATVRVQKNMSFADLMDNLHEAMADVTLLRSETNLDAAQVRLLEAKNIILALYRRNLKESGRLNLILGNIEVKTVVEDADHKLYALVDEYEDDDEKVFIPVIETIEHIAMVPKNKGNTSVNMMAQPVTIAPKYKRVMVAI